MIALMTLLSYTNWDYLWDTVCTWQFWIVGVPMLYFFIRLFLSFWYLGTADLDHPYTDHREEAKSEDKKFITVTYAPERNPNAKDANGKRILGSGSVEISYEKPEQADADLPSPSGKDNG